MSKINNIKITSIVFGLLILSFLSLLAFGLMPRKADAETYSLPPFRYGDYSSTSENSVPVIQLLNPNSKSSGFSAMNIEINGKNFSNKARARWNGSDRVTTYVNSTRLLMQLNDYDTNVLGDFFVTVYNPGGGISNSATFSITGTSLAPTSTPPAPVIVYVPTSPTVAKAPAKSEAKTEKSTDTESNIGSLAANALFGGGFIPSTLLQWLMLVIFVLALVILWRKLYITDTDRATHLKHE